LLSQPSTSSQPDAGYFFQQFLAAPLILFLYLCWKVYSRDWRLFVRVHEMDLRSGARALELDDEPMPVKTWKNLPLRMLRALF
jgi:amino acid transporter